MFFIDNPITTLYNYIVLNIKALEAHKKEIIKMKTTRRWQTIGKVMTNHVMQLREALALVSTTVTATDLGDYVTINGVRINLDDVRLLVTKTGYSIQALS